MKSVNFLDYNKDQRRVDLGNYVSLEPVDVRGCFYTFTLRVHKDMLRDWVLGGRG